MDARELRIGNWVLFNDYSGGPLQPYQIQGDDISRAAVNGVYHEPIPLTPEILEACGFVKRKEMFYKGEYCININDRDVLVGSRGTIFNGDPNYGVGINYELKYLHQLQNLYFALTGEELTVNIPQFAQ